MEKFDRELLAVPLTGASNQISDATSSDGEWHHDGRAGDNPPASQVSSKNAASSRLGSNGHDNQASSVDTDDQAHTSRSASETMAASQLSNNTRDDDKPASGVARETPPLPKFSRLQDHDGYNCRFVSSYMIDDIRQSFFTWWYPVMQAKLAN